MIVRRVAPGSPRRAERDDTAAARCGRGSEAAIALCARDLDGMLVLALVVPLLLLVTAVLAELAGRGRLRRNRLAGIRTRATVKSQHRAVIHRAVTAPCRHTTAPPRQS